VSPKAASDAMKWAIWPVSEVTVKFN